MINVYSKSEHELGRWLSNFAATPFAAPNGLRFGSVEAWWYWYTTGKCYPELMPLSGFAAKQAGRRYPQVAKVTKQVLKTVYLLKLEQNPRIKDLLLAYDGQFDHYYVMQGRKVPATQWLWTAKLWEEIRDELKQPANP